jgi:hypothetical protein
MGTVKGDGEGKNRVEVGRRRRELAGWRKSPGESGKGREARDGAGRCEAGQGLRGGAGRRRAVRLAGGGRCD